MSITRERQAYNLFVSLWELTRDLRVVLNKSPWLIVDQAKQLAADERDPKVRNKLQQVVIKVETLREFSELPRGSDELAFIASVVAIARTAGGK